MACAKKTTSAKKTAKKNLYSPNKKLNAVLKDIHGQLNDVGRAEVDNHKKLFRSDIDYGLAQNGNLLVYYDDVRKMYKKAGYKSVDKMSDEKLWDTYKRQVGYVARNYPIKRNKDRE